jgi:hypothetical protein
MKRNTPRFVARPAGDSSYGTYGKYGEYANYKAYPGGVEEAGVRTKMGVS